MRYLKIPSFFIITIFLLACTATGPKSALENMADAMEKFNPGQFMSNIDMKVFAVNYVNEISQSDPTLNSINNIGELLGLGNVSKLLEDILDFQQRLDQRFTRGVASGELMAECRSSEKANCPWVPQSLRNARVVQINENAAIAQVTTPAQITSWLSLHKIDDKWQVVGHAVLESTARIYATSIPNTRQKGSQTQGVPNGTNI